jgi:Cu+-exporting ATPase
MTCAKCAAKVQEAVLAVSGVDLAVADHRTNSVELDGDFDVESVLNAVLEAGYKLAPTVQTVTPDESSRGSESIQSAGNAYLLNVEGMSCASCVRTVESSLRAVDGVRSASVNYADSSAFVVTDSELETLTAAVKKAGYNAALREDQDAVSREQSISRQFRVSALKSVVALCLASVLMIDMKFGLLPEGQIFWLGTGLLVLGVMALTGGRYFSGALSALQQKQTTMDTLISLGTGTAWLYSMLVIIWPTLFPEESRHLFFEAALFVIGFVNLGKSLEEYARGKTSLSLQKLMDLRPPLAMRVTQAGEELVPVEHLMIGDKIRIRPGEIVAVDGLIESGRSAFDEHMLSGEVMPVEKVGGDYVTGGTINIDGAVIIRATQVGATTVLARMIEAVKEAQNSKPQIAVLTDQIASVFVPFVIALAFLVLFVWLWVMPGYSHAITAFMSVLIVACPCALGLAIPMSITVGVGLGASNGILIKNSDALQRASKIDTLVLDKTGTLTAGKPTVTDLILDDSRDGERVAVIARSLEVMSLHPLAKAITSYFESHLTKDVTDFETLPGGGVRGNIDGVPCVLGSPEFVRAQGCVGLEDIALPDGSLVCVASGQRVLGILVLQDQLRPEAIEAMADVRGQGIRIVMLSGDRASAVASVAEKIGADEYHAGLSPQDKQAHIVRMQKEGRQVAMVGDGINDSLALSTADIGFAMADGVDIAIESADIALMSGSLLGVPRAIALSRRVIANIKQNLFGAFGYNVLLIPVAAGALYPLTGTLMDPAFAGLAMAASSVTVVSNAVRLRFMA